MPNSGKLNVAWLYDDSLDRDDGVAQYVRTLGAWMTDEGHEVSYLVGQSKIQSWHGAPVYSLSKNLKVRWGGNRMTVPLKTKVSDIEALLGDNHFDVVHVTAPYSPLMAKRVINRLPANTALVGTWHIYPANRAATGASRLLKSTYGRSLSRFDEFISVSSAAAEYAKKVFKSDSNVIPNVIDLEQFKPKQDLKKTKPRVVFLGRLVKRKGAVEFVQSISRLRNELEFTEFEVLIGGDGPQRKVLEKLISDSGLSDFVKLLGYVPEAEKATLLASADIACFPSLYGESFGVVLIEAIAAGAKVVIGGNNPGYRTVLSEQPKLLVDVGEKMQVDLAGRLHYFLTNPDEAQRINDWQAKEIIKYDVKTVGPKIIELYRSAIDKRSTSGHN